MSMEQVKKYSELAEGDKVWWYGYKGTVHDILVFTAHRSMGKTVTTVARWQIKGSFKSASRCSFIINSNHSD